MKLNEDEALRVFLANPTEENALSVCKALGIVRVGEKFVSEIDRLHLAMLGRGLAMAAASEQLATMAATDYASLRRRLGELAAMEKVQSHDKQRWMRTAIRAKLENARLRSRRICGTCEGSGAAVYSFGEPSATPWEVADAVPSWAEWQTAQSYPYAAVISSPWTWWEDGGARCQFCRHCGGTGWVEVTR